MTPLRVILGAAGVALAAVGVIKLLDTGRDDIVDAIWWLGGGVLAHDLVLAPLTLLVAVLVVPLLPQWARGAACSAFLVLGSVTLLAVPVLGRFGATPGNPTLLDRNYWGGWLVFASVVLAVAGVWAALERRRVRSMS